MRIAFLTSIICIASAISAGSIALEAGDPEKGEVVFKKCKACHMIGAEARNRVGPHLNDIISSPAARNEDFKYSKAMKTKAEEGLVWDAENLDIFLSAPKAFVKGTSMGFVGLSKAGDRANVIAYLEGFSGNGATQNVDAGFRVSEEVLAIKGDMAYGEYLSSECTACHSATGEDKGIPAIIGWEIEDFVTALHAYREKRRENPVMQLVTGRLSDDEIASLAVYFQGLSE